MEKRSSQVLEMWKRSNKLAGPRDTRTGSGPFRGSSCFLYCFLIIPILCSAVLAGSVDDLTMGEAFYMSGNLAEAAQRLSNAAGSKTPTQAQRALYLLGRISLFTGDFRQAKEYFERSADIDGARAAGRWMALAGIGDTLYASGRQEEAIRRYRFAMGEAGNGKEGAVIGLKIALCEHSLGREADALAHLRAALAQIPVLSGWVGREEEFYHSMVMVGIDPPQQAAMKIYVKAGPVKGDFRVDEIAGPHVLVRETRKNNRSYLEFGPLTDSVEAMILSEKIQSRYSIPVEIITK
jgi:tetratricopeptide (TPR) repeat protein